MTLGPCAEPGCPELTDQTYCPAHRRGQAERKADGLTGARGSTRRWRRLRAAAIRRDGGRCTAIVRGRRCLETTRLHVHHKDGNPMNDVLSNLATLCEACHHDLERQRRVGGNPQRAITDTVPAVARPLYGSGRS